MFLKMHLVQVILVAKRTPMMKVMEKTVNQKVNPLMMMIHIKI